MDIDLQMENLVRRKTMKDELEFNERVEMKLLKIYSAILDLQERIGRIEDERIRKECKYEIERNTNKLKSIEYRQNMSYEIKKNLINEFNQKY